MPSKPNIIFVVETGSLAGGVRVIGELANKLALQDYPVSIYSVNPKETLTSWFQLSPLVKWYSFFRTGTIADYQQLAVVLEKQDAFKIATYWRTAFVTQACAKPGEGLYLVQDVETSYTSQPLLANNVLETYKLGLKMFTTSKWVQSQLPDTHYVGIGLDNSWRPNEKLKREQFVLACARIQALKGWDILCEVSRYIKAAGGKLVTYGIEKKLPVVVKAIEHHPGLSDSDIKRLCQSAGVFLSTSRHEGFNLTALEAMATGCPVVTTNSDGNMEYAEHGVNCLIADNPVELAIACATVINDKALGKKLGQAGVETAQRYRWNSVVDRLKEIL